MATNNQFAKYDPSLPAPQPITGWYDNTNGRYAGLPPNVSSVPPEYVEVSPEIWAAHMAELRINYWTLVDGVPVMAAPPAPPLTLAQQATALQAAGLTVTSTSQPGLTGTFNASSAMIANIQSEMLAVLVGDVFADGTTTVDWPTMQGSVVTFPDVVTFKGFALAMAGFVAAISKVQLGTSTTLPPSSVTIA